MKKIVGVIILLLSVCSACKEDRLQYTDAQKDVFPFVEGSFQAYTNNTIVGVLSFKSHYSDPVAMKDDKEKFLFEAHGECVFSDSRYAIPEEGAISCYYAFSKEADRLYFYYKGGVNTRKLLRSYAFSRSATATLLLTEADRTLEFQKVHFD
jgi:hypothetical protein